MKQSSETDFTDHVLKKLCKGGEGQVVVGAEGGGVGWLSVWVWVGGECRKLESHRLSDWVISFLSSFAVLFAA